MNLQAMELDKLEEMTIEREKMLHSTPSIKPVQETHLARDIKYLSGFGMRMHPIYKIPRFHNGIDFSAPEGTKIQATGDGIVKKVEKKSRSEEHTSELQSRGHLVCRLLLEKK